MFYRSLFDTIEEASTLFPVILVTGPRQVGKTTLLEMCSNKKHRYVTLDDLETRKLALTDPKLFLETFPAPLIIDEVQYAPDLLIYIKIRVDQSKKNGEYWLTGSQKFRLMQGITESLAGRVAVIDLLGLSLAEIQNRAKHQTPFLPTKSWFSKNRDLKGLSAPELFEKIWLGFFPRLHQSNGKRRDLFYRSYVQTYIERDVSDLVNVNNRNRFYDFLVALAARTGQLLNIADLSRDVGIDQKTASRWVNILETSGLVYLLRPYYRNITKRLITKTPKIYFLDTGLCAYLTKWPSSATLSTGAMSGAIFETFVFSELLKSYWHQGKDAPFYFYRDTQQNEVDLIIETADKLYPIEIKKRSNPGIEAAKAFSCLEKLDKEVGPGTIISLVTEPIPLSRNVTLIPASCL